MGSVYREDERTTWRLDLIVSDGAGARTEAYRRNEAHVWKRRLRL